MKCVIFVFVKLFFYGIGVAMYDPVHNMGTINGLCLLLTTSENLF